MLKNLIKNKENGAEEMVVETIQESATNTDGLETVEEIAEEISAEEQIDKKSKKEKKVKTPSKPGKFQFKIRFKIYTCFVVPILFMILIGVISYSNAKNGLNEKFRESTEQTLNMAADYLDVDCNFVRSEGMRYAFDKNYDKYFLGMMKSDVIEMTEFYRSSRSSLMAAQTYNTVISNVHMIVNKDMPNITTVKDTKLDGIFEEYKEAMMTLSTDGKNIPNWIDVHPLIDDLYEINPNEYFISYQMLASNRFGYVVVDVRQEAVADILSGMDFGEGSIVAFITPSGKELVNTVTKDGSDVKLATEPVFKNETFYTDALNAEELSGSSNVKYNKGEYLFLYNRSEETGIMLCALIPVKTVTGQAETIKSITVTLVILATIIAVLIGTFISLGIQKNMKNISKNLDEVANGDLTVDVRAYGNDEFRTLAASVNNMIGNNRNLVMKLNGTVDELGESAAAVNTVSENINDYSADISEAIGEISVGMSKQAEHAEECVVKTNVLSEKIENISKMVEAVLQVTEKTEQMISKGTEIVELLAKRAEETTELTSQVGNSINMLKEESESINGFVATINNISSQTNLLSLNASIEAARAGEAGRGFAVVAEEIRKLADESASAAGEIKRKVESIGVRTTETVKSANDAEAMVSKQTEAVEDVTKLFTEMNKQMEELYVDVKEIAKNASETDQDRNATMEAVENISAIIQQTASSSALVSEMAIQLKTSVEQLAATADNLDADMLDLKREISAFKVTGEVSDSEESVSAQEMPEEQNIETSAAEAVDETEV